MRIRARTNARARISSVRRPEIAEIASDACRSGSGCCARQFRESLRKADPPCAQFGAEVGGRAFEPWGRRWVAPDPSPGQTRDPVPRAAAAAAARGRRGRSGTGGTGRTESTDPSLGQIRDPGPRAAVAAAAGGRRGTGGTRGTRKTESIGSIGSIGSGGEGPTPRPGAGAGAGAGRGKKIADDLGHDRARPSARGPGPYPPASSTDRAWNPPNPRILPETTIARSAAGRATIVGDRATPHGGGGGADRGTEPVAAATTAGTIATRTIALPRGAPPNSTEEGT